MKKLIIFFMLVFSSLSVVSALSINNSIPTEIDTLNIDFSSYLNCIDSYSCSIEIQPDNENIPIFTKYDLENYVSQGAVGFTAPYGMYIKEGGTDLYVTNIDTDSIQQYSLSTPFDLSSKTLVNTLSLSSTSTLMSGLDFSSDGTKMFVMDRGFDRLNQYSLSTPFDISTATFSGSFSGSGWSQPYSITFNNDGSKFFMMKTSSDRLEQYSLSTPYDVTTSSFSSSFSVNSQDTFAVSVDFNEIGDKMYILGDTSNRLYQYSLSTPFDISTASYDNIFKSMPTAVLSGLRFSKEGNNFYITDGNADRVFNYQLEGGLVTLTSGNKSYTITASNSTDTIQETGNLLINPEIIVQARDTLTDSLISNFNLGDFSTTGTNLTFNVYDLGLGNTTLLFNKMGYDKENVTISLNNTSEGLITIYINPVTLFAEAYDGETLTKLNNFDVQIKNSTDVVTFTGLNNLSKLYSEIPQGDIEVTFSAENYSNALFYTTTTPYSSVSFDVYLTPLNLSSIITFTLTDINTRQFLEGVTVEARRVVVNETVTIQQTKTTGTGVAYLILDELKDYEFIFSKEGYTQAIINSIPSVTDYNVRLNPQGETFTFLNGVNARFYPQIGNVYKNTSYDFVTQITGDSISRLEYTLKDTDGNVIDSLNTTNPTGSTFETNFFIPVDYNQTKIISEVKVFINGDSFIHSKEWQVAGVLGGTLKDLREFGHSQDEEFKLLKFFIVLISYIITIIIGNRNPITRDYVSALALLPTVIFTYLGWIPLLYGTLISIAIIVLYVGGNKRG